MIPELRQDFLARWTPESYRRLQSILVSRCGGPIGFRVSETPCFIPPRLLKDMLTAGRELIRQLHLPAYRAVSDAAVPAAFRVPGAPPNPLFLQVDFGLVQSPDGVISPKLVEIQGFPSLYAFHSLLASASIEACSLDPSLCYHPGPLDDSAFQALLGEAILGGRAPENVILLEIDPAQQKTNCDFRLTQKWFGVRDVCITKVRKRGRRLFYDRDGVETPIERIYNRVIVDEQIRRNIHPAFAWTDELDVEWAGHPNFFFRISKFSLPFLRHESVPPAYFLHRLNEWPEDLSRWVLKPLYSFAGAGVRVGPARDDLDAVPPAERPNWILQERCHFTPLIATPAGPAKAEVRIMYIGGRELRPAGALVRMGRGLLMGVDQNWNTAWVGASAGLWPSEA